jgi:hypothetical protein
VALESKSAVLCWTLLAGLRGFEVAWVLLIDVARLRRAVQAKISNTDRALQIGEQGAGVEGRGGRASEHFLVS